MMRKLAIMIITIILFSSLAFAEESDLFDYHALGLEVTISNNFEIIPTSTKYYLDQVSAQMSWFPQESYRQEVDYITTDPEAEFDEETGFYFEWREPSQTSFSIEQKSGIKTKNEFRRVTNKIAFPIKDLDPIHAEFIQPQEIIDINDEIRQTASEIVEGEDDLYSAVFKIGVWVEDNIDYDLTTLTAEASQKSSWVLDNKRGVCDEITNLFISMCRSVGIPARFVTGLSYSNINQQNDGWGPHGWAEVYFPSVGWIPFDITYKEIGYIDAAHVSLKKGLDAKETSINYATRGVNTDIKPGKLEFDVKVKSQDYKVKPLLDVDAEIAEDRVGFGSYNLLILTINNPHSYYVATRIYLTNVKDLEFIDDNYKSVLLAPGQEKKVYWMIKVSPRLKSGFIYEFPIKIETELGAEAETSFKSAKDFSVYSEEYMGIYIITEPSDEKAYSKNVLVTCSATEDKVFLNENVNISCVIDNKGDKNLGSLRICLADECATTRVPAREALTFAYTREFDTLGIKVIVFKAQNELIEKSYYTVISVQDKPLLEITDLSYPGGIEYEETGEITFFIRKKSTTFPNDVKIMLDHDLMNEEWSIPVLDHDHKYTVLIKGENLKVNDNDFTITVTYKDKEREQYKTLKGFSIELEDPTILQKIMIWLHIAEIKIEKWIGGI